MPCAIILRLNGSLKRILESLHFCRSSWSFKCQSRKDFWRQNRVSTKACFMQCRVSADLGREEPKSRTEFVPQCRRHSPMKSRMAAHNYDKLQIYINTRHIYSTMLQSILPLYRNRQTTILNSFSTLILVYTGLHFSFDVLPSWADQGSCAHKCVCVWRKKTVLDVP